MHRELQPETSREERPAPRQTGNEPAGAAAETKPARALAEQDAFYPAFWERVVEQSSVAPQGQDPAYWPSRVLFEFDALASGDRAYIKDKAKYELAGKLAPIKDSIKKVRTAYQIVAYPACTSENMREAIEGEIQMDQEIHERDQVELGSGEAEILRQLCEAPRYALYNDQKVL